ncbi:MAG: hypothetical protein M3P06_00125 [Acidobacteriota bacterium]|nr:hypothetical protein [Acidobacteriota bacterium]
MRLAALLTLAYTLLGGLGVHDADKGYGVDPNGFTFSGDVGCGIDPNGCTSSINGGGAMDPNGGSSNIERNCYTACIDPNG